MPRGKESVGWLQSTKARHNGRAGRKGLWFRARPVGPANRARACCATAAESGNINETLTPAADTPAARTAVPAAWRARNRSEEHTSELQSLMRNSYAVFRLKKKKKIPKTKYNIHKNV